MYTEISKVHVISQNSQCMHSFHIFSERVHLLQEFLSGPDQDGPCEVSTKYNQWSDRKPPRWECPQRQEAEHR